MISDSLHRMSNAYPFLLAIGVLAAMIWLSLGDVRLHLRQKAAQIHRRIDTATVAVIAGLVGARIGYVLDRLAYYRSFPLKAFSIWEGGLSWIGALIGVLIGVALLALVWRLDFFALLDPLALPGAFIGFISWFGCLIDGCGYGRAAELGIFTPVSADIFGVSIHRYPVQTAGAILDLLILFSLYNLQRRELPSGTLSGAALSLISLANFLLTFLRGDSVRSLAGIRLDAIMALVFVAIGAMFVYLAQRRKPERVEG